MKLSYTSCQTKAHGYTLVELVVASGIIMMGAITAYHMAANALLIEEMNTRIGRGLSLQENYARTWQLGLAPATIASILPRSSEVTLTSSTAPVNLPEIGSLEGLSITAQLKTGVVAGGTASGVTRNNTVTIIRATR